jgi:GMP synthase-like glutamine amidotransferase
VTVITAVGNDGDDDLGLLYPALEMLNGRVVVRRIDRSAPAGEWSVSEDTELVVLLGSDWSVHQRTGGRSVRTESSLTRRMIAGGVPVLGICYGAQLLSHAMGGRVELSPVPELGWVEVASGEPALRGRWFQWHDDRSMPPIGSTASAATSGNIQAWQYRSGFGIQFHPEVTDEILRRWCTTGAETLRTRGIEPESLLAGVSGENLSRVTDLLGHVLNQVNTAAPLECRV